MRESDAGGGAVPALQEGTMRPKPIREKSGAGWWNICLRPVGDRGFCGLPYWLRGADMSERRMVRYADESCEREHVCRGSETRQSLVPGGAEVERGAVRSGSPVPSAPSGTSRAGVERADEGEAARDTAKGPV